MFDDSFKVRRYRIDDQDPARAAEWEAGGHPTVVVTWSDLAEVNEEFTMEDIAEIKVGEITTVGMCDEIERLPDADPVSA